MHQMRETEQAPCNDPAVLLVTRRLAEFFKVLSNPRRVSILEELRSGEKDVSSLSDSLLVSQSATSQQIAILRAHKLIDERKEGRTVFYRLKNPEIAIWIGDGLKFAGQKAKDEDSFLTEWPQSNSRDEEDMR